MVEVVVELITTFEVVVSVEELVVDRSTPVVVDDVDVEVSVVEAVVESSIVVVVVGLIVEVVVELVITFEVVGSVENLEVVD